MEHTRDVMSEVEAVSGQYEALAVSCSQLYFALETLRDVHFLYHFSLRFFQDILAQVSCGAMCERAHERVVLLFVIVGCIVLPFRFWLDARNTHSRRCGAFGLVHLVAAGLGREASGRHIGGAVC